MRWNAPGVVAAAQAERLLAPGERGGLAAAARRRAGEPELVAVSAPERAVDRRLAELAAVLGAVLADEGGGWALPRRAATVVDSAYVLAAAGLLAADHPDTAINLLQHHLRVE